MPRGQVELTADQLKVAKEASFLHTVEMLQDRMEALVLQIRRSNFTMKKPGGV